MIRSMDTLTKSFQLLQKRQENVSSNISNSQTHGYQSQRLFQKTLDEVNLHNYQGGPEVNRRNEIGGFTFGNELAGTSLNTERGALEQTGRETDYAVGSDGYFSIQMPDGQEAYTRNGHFTTNNQGQLVTQEGYLVLGNNNQGIPANQPYPAFRVMRFENAETLNNLGNGYYGSDAQGEVIQNPLIRQGYLETSNVKVADEMVELIQTAREFEANQKTLSTINQTLQKATNEIGRA